MMSGTPTKAGLTGPARKKRSWSEGCRTLMSPKSSTMPRLARMRLAITRSLMMRETLLMEYPARGAATVVGPRRAGNFAVAGLVVTLKDDGSRVVLHERKSGESRNRRARPLGQGAHPSCPGVRRVNDRRRLQPLRRQARRLPAGVRGRAGPRPRHYVGRPADQGRDPDGPERAAPAARARGGEGAQARLHREADRQHARGRTRDRGAGEDPWRDRHGRP